MEVLKKVLKIIGILDAVCLILFGVFYFMGLNVPMILLPIFLVVLIFCACFKRENG